jgi:hypothetical protein
MSSAEINEYFVTGIERAMYRTLVVGGEASFVQRKLTPRLRRHFLRVTAHWPWKKQAGAFPEAIDVLFVCTDMLAHSLSNAAVEEARKRNIPIIMGGRKHALNIEKLEAAGFPEYPLFAAQKPLVSEKRVQKTHAASPSVVAALPPIPVHELTLPTAVNSSEETNMPPTTPALPALLRAALRPKVDADAMPPTTPALPALPHLTRDEHLVACLLASEPGLSNTRVLERMGDGWAYGKVSVIGAKVRRALGISIPRNAKSDMHISRAPYLRACEALNVTPVDLPPDGHYTRYRKHKTSEQVVPASVRRVPPSASTRAAPPSAIDVVTMLSSEVPAILIAAYEREEKERRAEQQLRDAPTTTVEALRLLLEAMRAENVSQISIRDDGTVSMDRRVVVSSSLML